MKSKLTLLLLFLPVMSLFAQDLKPAPEGMTAEMVINKYVDAIGGAAKLNKINSISVWAKTEIQGQEIWITTHTARGNKYYMEMGTPDMTYQKQVFNGQKAYIIAGGQRTEITGDALENLKSEAELFAEMKYKEMGFKMDLLGIESVNDKDAYKINLSQPSGTEFVEYYDTETNLKIRTEHKVTTPEGKVMVTSDYGDYRDVKGILYPFSLKQEVGPQLIELVITLVQVNKVKPSIFEVE